MYNSSEIRAGRASVSVSYTLFLEVSLPFIIYLFTPQFMILNFIMQCSVNVPGHLILFPSRLLYFTVKFVSALLKSYILMVILHK